MRQFTITLDDPEMGLVVNTLRNHLTIAQGEGVLAKIMQQLNEQLKPKTENEISVETETKE